LGRKELAEESLTTWIDEYCAEFYDFSKSGDFHKEIDAEVDIALRPGRRFVGMFPREHGKSTRYSGIVPAYAACTGKKKHMCLCAYSADKADEKMQEVMFLLQENPKIRRDYGDKIKPKSVYGKSKDRRNKLNEVELANNCVIRAFESMSRHARGALKFSKRPDLYIFDDPEDEIRVDNKDYRSKFTNWLNTSVLPSMDSHRGSFLWLGTRLHMSSPLSSLVLDPGHRTRQDPRWRRKIYKAYSHNKEDELSILWPEYFTWDMLMEKKLDMGPVAFNREFLHECIDPETQVFKDEYYRFYDHAIAQKQNNRYGLIDDRRNHRAFDKIAMACDPAFTDNRQSDNTGISVVGMDNKSKRYYILAIKRLRGGLENMQQALVEIYNEFRPDIVGLEASAAQITVVQMMIQNTFLPIKPMKPTDKKETRIYAMEPHFANGRMWFPDPKYYPGTSQFREEADHFPTSTHDDMMDSLAMALELLGAGGRTRVHAGSTLLHGAEPMGAY